MLGDADGHTETMARKTETGIAPSGERLVRFIVTEALGDDVFVQEALDDLAAADEAEHGGQRQWRHEGRAWQAVVA